MFAAGRFVGPVTGWVFLFFCALGCAGTSTSSGGSCESPKCAEGMTLEGGQCISRKMVPCDRSVVPDSAEAITVMVSVTWDDTTGWSPPPPCEWSGAEGGETGPGGPDQPAGEGGEPGDTTPDKRSVPCDDSAVPPNARAIYTKDQIEWVEGAWTPREECDWECLPGYVREDDTRCINTRMMPCDDSGVPEGAEAEEVQVRVTWSEEAGWSAPGPCPHSCARGFVATPDGGCGQGAPLAIDWVWANDGGDKVVREDLRARDGVDVSNSVWDGERISVFGAANEVVSFNLVLEASDDSARGVRVTLDRLSSDQAVIESTPADLGSSPKGAALFDWRERPIELFYVRYLQIVGLSRLTWGPYDERHVPRRFQRPWTGEGYAEGGWSDRPDHDLHYPDIAVPLELHTPFEIAAGTSQSVWVDIYVPPGTPPGTYTGTLRVFEGESTSRLIPVSLQVRAFSLPDVPPMRSILYASDHDIYDRFLGRNWAEPGEHAYADEIVDRHFQVAHRHLIDLIGADEDPKRVNDAWLDRIDGSLFTPARGYAGPGVGLGVRTYSIGVYGLWTFGWDEGNPASVQDMASSFAAWMQANAPDVFAFVYLIDEPGAGYFPQIEQWSQWIDGAPAPGPSLAAMSTVNFRSAVSAMPSLDLPCRWATFHGPTPQVVQAYEELRDDPARKTCVYNGVRPAAGTFATEDDGVALRVTAWTQYKKDIDIHFYWQSTYYDNYQGGQGQTDVFTQAQTFGGSGGWDPVLGQTGWNYTNGDGVLFYPGTDLLFPQSSYGVDGPFASLRLKHWRRGIQDVAYIRLAAQVDPARTRAIVERTIPEVLWEVGVTDLGDPTWVRKDISWSTDPDDWEAARAELADIIEAGP